MSTIIIDPTDERTPIRRMLAARPESITGTVALLDINKPRGDVLLDLRNVYDPEAMRAAGFRYHSIGRP